jgi:hypothetical protein
MSVISDHDLERLARLLMRSDERDDLRPEIVRLLWMDDDTCPAPKLPQNKPSTH